MPTDTERREVAARLRHSWANVPDKNLVRHQLRVLFEIYSAVGLADDDDADAIDLFDRLADLIDPPYPDATASYKGWRAEVYDPDGVLVSPSNVAADLVRARADGKAPSEPKVRFVAEVKVDGERLERLAHDVTAELTGIDRDALLALADRMETMAGMGALLTADGLEMAAVSIREALGVES